MSLQKLHYENISGTLVRREGLLSWRCPLCKAEGQSLEVMRTCPECGSKEAALPGAQNAPVEQDESVRKSWARFSHELHRSPDAPYPGMSDAFERHFSQSFTDRDWRVESGVWAAAWKAAKRHGAQPAPSVPDGWKLVPIEPTEKMINEGTCASTLPGPRYIDSACAKQCWTNMLAAAPEAKP